LQRFSWKVLHVSVDQEYMGARATEKILESRPDCLSLSSVSRVTDDVSARLARPLRRTVCRAIVHDHDVRQLPAKSSDDL
jgi:hypothetical protein